MTDTSPPDTPQPAEISGFDAVERSSVKRRSKRVKLLRWAIPALIVGLVAINLSWITIQSLLNAFNTPKANLDEIRMTNPRFQGQTDKGERYTITGLEALRKGRQSKTVGFKSPALDLKGSSDNPVHLQADTGRLEEDENRFYLKGHVVIKGGGNDFTFTTEEAIVDLTKSEIFGDKHVEAKGSMGHIIGEAFLISDNGNLMSVTGRGDTQVQANLTPDK